jgi:hypothetical protein
VEKIMNKKDKKRIVAEEYRGVLLPKVTVYLTEKDVDKRLDVSFIIMLKGLSKMLSVWGDFECKGGGCIDPRSALFHCRACVVNGIRGHVDQAIQNWETRT